MIILNLKNLEIIRRVVQTCAIMASVGLPIGIFISFFFPVGYTYHEEVLGTITHYWSEPVFNWVQGIIFIICLVGILATNGSIKRYLKRRTSEEREGTILQRAVSQAQLITSQINMQSIPSSNSQVQAVVRGMKYCLACGEGIKDIAQYCEFCGTQQ